MTKQIVLILAILFITISCDNDADPSPNDDQCNYQGLTFNDTNNNTQTLIPEDELSTGFYPNGLGAGVGQVEINKTDDMPNYFLTTKAVTLNAVDTSGTLRIAGVDYTVTVTCQRAGTAVGDEFRFDVVDNANNAEAEFCVIIDSVIP